MLRVQRTSEILERKLRLRTAAAVDFTWRETGTVERDLNADHLLRVGRCGRAFLCRGDSWHEGQRENEHV